MTTILIIIGILIIFAVILFFIKNKKGKNEGNPEIKQGPIEHTYTIQYPKHSCDDTYFNLFLSSYHYYEIENWYKQIGCMMDYNEKQRKAIHQKINSKTMRDDECFDKYAEVGGVDASADTIYDTTDNTAVPNSDTINDEDLDKVIKSMTPNQLDNWYYQKRILAKVKFTKNQIDRIDDIILGYELSKGDCGDVPVIVAPKRKRKPSQAKKTIAEYHFTISNDFKEHPNTFTAIDFETATPDGYACQLGIVDVVDGSIVDEKEFLIQPPKNEYAKMNSLVHGLTSASTIDSPTFADLWQEIKPCFENKVLVAHNLPFDMNVLRKNIEYYNLDDVNLKDAICSCCNYDKIGLFSACQYFGIELDAHHNALADAKACANLMLAYRQHMGEEFTIPYIKEPSYRKIASENFIQDLSSVKECDTVFYNKKVVISGVFEDWPVRNDLAAKLKSLGANVQSAVSKTTDILIIGNNPGPAKLQQAQQYEIKIIEEKELSTNLKCNK